MISVYCQHEYFFFRIFFFLIACAYRPDWAISEIIFTSLDGPIYMEMFSFFLLFFGLILIIFLPRLVLFFMFSVSKRIKRIILIFGLNSRINEFKQMKKGKNKEAEEEINSKIEELKELKKLVFCDEV